MAFASTSTNLVAGQSEAVTGDDVFLFTRATGAVTLVSHTPAGATTAANSYSVAPVLSADGAYVAFLSNATNVVGGQIDQNAIVDVSSIPGRQAPCRWCRTSLPARQRLRPATATRIRSP